MMTKILTILCCLALLFAGCGRDEPDPIETESTVVSTEAAVIPGEEDGIVYISLGDSIARGCSLKDIPTERYSARIKERFAEDGVDCVEYNYGVDGQTSTELIAYAKTLPLADAEFITISIGANNVLGPAFQFLSAYDDYSGNPKTTYTKESVAVEYDRFVAAADEGLNTLSEDIPEIVRTIRAQNEDCSIIFLTVYNPYAVMDMTFEIRDFPISFSALSGSYVTRLSEIIASLGEENGYAVADVRTSFDGKEGKLIYAANATESSPGNMDPHPNAKGHNMIAETLYPLMKQDG